MSYVHQIGSYESSHSCLLKDLSSLTWSNTLKSALLDICAGNPPFTSEWVIKFNGLSWAADIKVHVIHKSNVTITYTLESLSSLTYITHNLQVTINLRKNYKKKTNAKSEGTHEVDL